MYLEQINAPSDVRALPSSALPALCEEIRRAVIESSAAVGGHMGSNLAVVELTVALHRVFETPRDKVVFDVSHQTYPHKMLTGRALAFLDPAHYEDVSGFSNPRESEHDLFSMGHTSTSVSLACGLVAARDLEGQDYDVVAVIGDGALTGGMAYEALSNAGTSGEPLLVVLNDNNMAIAQNVGGLSRHLAHLRVSPRYLRAKARIKGRLGAVPGGKAVTRAISRMKARLKRLLLPTSLFEQMGFIYLGPVDGHDLKSVCELLALAKKIKKPVLLHVMTQKGRGYVPSEREPEKYHGVTQFDPVTGAFAAEKKTDFSACFGRELCALAERDARLCAITAAMPSGTGLTRFAERFPARFYDVGIAEEHAVAMAAGMAAQGLVPVVALYSTFLQRAYDQIVHDVAIERLHVVFCVDRAGIVGADGATHNGVLDVAFLRSVPGMKIFCPSNFAELRSMMTAAIYHEAGPAAIRYPRGGEGAFRTNTAGKPLVCVREAAGHDVTLLTHGTMVDEALAAAEQLEQKHLRVQVYKVNEISAALDAAWDAHRDALCGWCVVIEDNVQSGSLGEWVAGRRADRTSLLNTGDRFLPHGSVDEVRRLCGLDADAIAAYVWKNHRGKEQDIG